ncbi:MAG: hypothetical protein WCL23_00830 [Candidatus Moraniibacteriota bacterium]
MERITDNKKESDAASTQKYVDVEEVRDGVMILRNGSIRAVLLASSINFDLKSTDEQDAIIIQYQNFLNSLDFPLQIIVHSRRFRIEPYLEKLKQQEKTQENDLLRFQISEYANFIKSLTDVSNIMSKSFFVVVPFAPSETKEGGFFTKMGGIFNPVKQTFIGGEVFETYKNQLFQRADLVASALMGTGVRTTLLGTEEVIELLYNSYNPSLFTSSVVKNIESVELTGR